MRKKKEEALFKPPYLAFFSFKYYFLFSFSIKGNVFFAQCMIA